MCNYLFAKIGIYIFETSRYKEHDYLDSDVYAHDLAIKPGEEKQIPSHYWMGHATSLITVPTDDAPLHVLTDPVEGDLLPFVYPRMTKEGNLIDGSGDKRLPKIIYEALAQYRLRIACDKARFMSFQRHGKLSGSLKELMITCIAIDRGLSDKCIGAEKK